MPACCSLCSVPEGIAPLTLDVHGCWWSCCPHYFPSFLSGSFQTLLSLSSMVQIDSLEVGVNSLSFASSQNPFAFLIRVSNRILEIFQASVSDNWCCVWEAHHLACTLDLCTLPWEVSELLFHTSHTFLLAYSLVLLIDQSLLLNICKVCIIDNCIHLFHEPHLGYEIEY